MLCTLLWLEFEATENADLDDDDDELNDPNDEFDVPDVGRGKIFGPVSRVDPCTWVVTGVLGVECDLTDDVPFASCVVSSIK